MPKIYSLKCLKWPPRSKSKRIFSCDNERDNIYNLRNRQTDLAQPMPKKEFVWRCFNWNNLYWNNLPSEAKIAECSSSFKSILRRLPTVTREIGAWDVTGYARGARVVTTLGNIDEKTLKVRDFHKY